MMSSLSVRIARAAIIEHSLTYYNLYFGSNEKVIIGQHKPYVEMIGNIGIAEKTLLLLMRPNETIPYMTKIMILITKQNSDTQPHRISNTIGSICK